MHPVTECLIWNKIPFVICYDQVVTKRREKIIHKQIIPENNIILRKKYYKISNVKLWQNGFTYNIGQENTTSYTNFEIGFYPSKSIKFGDFIPFLNKWSGISFIEYNKDLHNKFNERTLQLSRKKISLIDIDIIDVYSFKKMVLK